MLRENALILTQAVDLCRSFKQVQVQMKQMQKIQELDKHAKPLNATSAIKPFKKIACKFCGGKHAYGRNLYPAFGKRCFNCNKPNHFSSVCTQPHKNIKCVEEEAQNDKFFERFPLLYTT